VTVTGLALAPPLWQQLQATAGALAAVAKGESANAALLRVATPLRPGVQSLLFATLRHWGRAHALRAILAQRSPPPEVDSLLCVALALCWAPELSPYEPFTLVNQAVEAAKNSPKMKAQATFINACLRRFLRERDALVAATDNDLQARWNHPPWWVAQLQRDHPHQWAQVLRAGQAAAPMVMRVNQRRIQRSELAAQWLAKGLPSEDVGVDGLILAQAMPVERIPGFSEGLCSVQDAGAQMAARLLLQALPGHGAQSRILDACAAPGGKTAHLLELSDAQVVALDVDPARCERIQGNLVRLGLHARVSVGDAANPDAWWDGQLFDAILLDAPCTASGIVRRHPDVPWLRRDSDVPQLARLQQRLMQALWPVLKPGGVMLYCTCSVFKAEGEAQIKAFLQHNTQALGLPCVGHLLPQNRENSIAVADNLPCDHDGFFYALLQKPLG
jgi:16S rRNA (cytosine967-C5)-methyltransferase